MALVKSPTLSQISGKIADINFRTLKSGKIELATSRDPTTKPRTEEQEAINQTYGTAVQTWRTATDQKRDEWTAEGEAEGISGFNILIRKAFATTTAKYGTAKYGTDTYS